MRRNRFRWDRWPATSGGTERSTPYSNTLLLNAQNNGDMLICSVAPRISGLLKHRLEEVNGGEPVEWESLFSCSKVFDSFLQLLLQSPNRSPLPDVHLGFPKALKIRFAHAIIRQNPLKISAFPRIHRPPVRPHPPGVHGVGASRRWRQGLHPQIPHQGPQAFLPAPAPSAAPG
ncbi:hypothetical protein B296_00058506 [Ensete ventricosum]|uniref:Uncharacterized protein n=1 Tax=Ensete ventricosum TaxID=4639 RepID=A0A426X953_ENSVE|nr:hypothetical protein B296_00058506 [Ensete ventricosum]